MGDFLDSLNKDIEVIEHCSQKYVDRDGDE